MADKPGPETLRALARNLRETATSEIDALFAHADAWESERAALAQQVDSERGATARLMEELAAVQQRLELLEQDRKWWQENAIKRRKRSDSRRSGRSPRRRNKT